MRGRGSGSGRLFVPVQVVEEGQREVPPLELCARSGIRILVPAAFDADHLWRVLRALESPC